MKTSNWKENDLDLDGSELEERIIKESKGGDDDKVFDGVGKDVSFRMWRIEKFHLKEWPEEKHNQLFEGDCYLVLNTSKPDPNDSKLRHDIHVWIGEESTQDEYGTAVYKMMQLDKKLGGAAMTHREIQGFESGPFLQYFDNKMSYMDGGIESGLENSEPTKEEPHLYHVKGDEKKGTLRLTQVKLRRDYLNSGDVFVLVVSKSEVYMWVGKEANADEKEKGLQVATDFCTEPGSKVVSLTEGETDSPTQAEAFWTYLPEKIKFLGPIKRRVYIQAADHKDERGREFIPTLYQIPDVVGQKAKRVAKGKPFPSGNGEKQFCFRQSLLNQHYGYLLDTGFHLYVWIGEQSNQKCINNNAIHYADAYFKAYRRPFLPISIIRPYQESTEFQKYFVEGGGCSCILL